MGFGGKGQSMERIKKLNFYQKGILIVMIIMALVFAVIYPKTIARVGYRFNDAILVPAQENGITTYSGKMKGEYAQFLVYDDNKVEFHYGDRNYGQYVLREDPEAIPKDLELQEQMTGIEIINGDKIFFRGGVLDFGDHFYLYNEDGMLDDFGFSYVTNDGIERDEMGNAIDVMEPSASTIYELLNDPELTHKGDALAWFGAVFVSILNALSILFADELFRFNLAFQIRNVEDVEPSEWEMAGRYIAWSMITIMVFVVFISGLQ